MSAQQPASVPGSGSGSRSGSVNSAPYLLSHPHRQHQLPFPPDAPVMKLTRGTSCVLCQQRKVRCDKNKPCANCVRAGAECRVVPPQPPRRRKKRLQDKDLIDRLRKYEALLTQHGIPFDAIGHELKGERSGLDDVDELGNDFEALKTSHEGSSSPSAPPHAFKRHGAWFSLHQEFRANEQQLHDSSEDDMDGSTIHHAFDRMFSNQDGFPFTIGGQPTSVTACHPSTIHILQFWQIYIDNVNPLLKITHVPSIQAQIIEATSQLNQAPKNLEALMFGIYLMAISSLDDADVQRIFNDSRHELLGRYFAALQQSLINASFMRLSDPLTLQAYILYLLAIRWFIDPRQVFCLIGIAVRIAQRMGLHRDAGRYGLPPFEVEQRRRLWWTVAGYDRRIGEMMGSTVTALSTDCDCKLPMNINDSDLHVDGKEPLTPHTGPTEMTFALTRIELSMAIAGDNKSDNFQMHPTIGSPPPTPGGTTIRLAGQDCPPFTLDSFCTHIEATYLVHCDPKIPLHFFTLTLARQSLCKMYIIDFLVNQSTGRMPPRKGASCDSLFQQAIQMIECDNVLLSSESLRPFKWFAMQHFPFPAYMFLVQELRHQTSGRTVERAWETIQANHDLRGLINNLHSPIHMALGNLFIKAWAVYEESQRAETGMGVVTPHFICIIRDRADKRRRARLENRPDPSLDQPPVSFPRSRIREFTATPPNNLTMTTPPVDPNASASTTMQPTAMAAAPVEEIDVDWSYLIAGYQDSGGYQGYNTFGGFGNPMGGMGGAGFGPGNGNMFGN